MSLKIDPKKRVPIVVGTLVVLVVLIQGGLSWRAASRTNKVALSSLPKPVSVEESKAATYRPSRMFVGSLDPWVAANVGPQFISAYVETVLVRPGAVVKKGQVLATLDCRDASASSKAVSMQARAIQEEQKAVADEAARMEILLKNNFISSNEVERRTAQSTSQAAQLEATKATLVRSQIGVDDCVLRAPFDGEVGERNLDPGAFVHPGNTIVSVVDRSIIRFSTDVPEGDFEIVAPDVPLTLHILANGKDLPAKISRRAPAADPSTRTVHFEADIPDPNRTIPVGTTAEAHIEVGQPQQVTAIPLVAASVRGKKATVFVVEGPAVRRRVFDVVGEDGGSLFLGKELSPGNQVVVEGQALLEDKDLVTAKDLTTKEAVTP